MQKVSIFTLMFVMAFVFTTSGNTALAFPESGKVGQKVNKPHPDGAVTRVEFREIESGGKTWYLIMPYRGDFGGDPYLDDGWIMNVYTDREGNFVLYIIVHETDPRWSEDLPQIWGSWAIFEAKAVGKTYSAGQ